MLVFIFAQDTRVYFVETTKYGMREVKRIAQHEILALRINSLAHKHTLTHSLAAETLARFH